MSEILAQKRNEVNSYGTVTKKYWEEGEWTVDPAVTNYDEVTPKPNVSESIFTLPFPQDDIVNNPHLLEDAQEVDVRATYPYNF